MSKTPTNELEGAPAAGAPSFLEVGRLRRTHGIHGELVLEVLTDFPERIRRGVTLYVGPDRRPLRLRSRRGHAEGLLIAFQGYEDREAAGELRNQGVFVRADDRPPLEEGEYYHHQILGLPVFDEQRRALGRVIEILETGSNDVLIIRSESGPELLLPLLETTLLGVDLERGELTVRLLPGLLPNEPEADEDLPR